MSTRIFIPTTSAEDWKQFLAEPERQWRTGFSARSLAYCWESANGFPPEIEAVFIHSDIPAFRRVELLLAIPEYKVELPGGGRASQNDLFVLAKDKDDNLVSVTVEGKVSESFDKTIADWNPSSSEGKLKRFEFLRELLGLKAIPPNIRYQLLHRSASAILEGKRFHAKSAVMLIHSFSPGMLWLDDFQAFTNLFGVHAEPEKLYFIKEINELRFCVAWVKGNPKYLEM